MQRKKIYKILSVLILSLNIVLFSQDHIFENVLSETGISGMDGLGHSVTWIDINNDGYDELVFSNQNSGGFWIFKNNSGETFTDITTISGLANQTGYRILAGEITGDSYSDLFFYNWDGLTRIYKNNGDETFTDITAQSGVSVRVLATADFDNDGDLDLIGNHYNSSILVIEYNDGEGNFSSPQELGSTSSITATVCFDYNNDNLIDIYHLNKLYKNLGNREFEDITAEAGLTYNGAVSGLTTGDFNNDGLIDVYIGSYSSDGCRLFKNNGDETFENVTGSAGVLGHSDTRLVNFIDYNNDGFLDIFVSHHNFYSYSNVLYKNNGDETFTNTSVDMNISGEWIGDYFGTGWADYNRDGAIDFFAAGHIDTYRLYKNTNCPNNFLEIDLVGTFSNNDAIGTTVSLWAGEKYLTRQIIGGEGKLDYHSNTLHFGLGEETFVDSVKIIWSNSPEQTLTGIEGNQILEIVEGGIVGIENYNGEWLMVNGELKQNYPNPFNPVTKIHYRLPVETMHASSLKSAEIVVYNAMGQEVWSSPVTRYGILPVTGSILFDGSKFNSGIYYYSLVIDQKRLSTKSMVLSK